MVGAVAPAPGGSGRTGGTELAYITHAAGGIAVLGGAAAGLLLLRVTTEVHLPPVPFLIAVGLVALVGLADDFRGIPAWLRLLVQTASAAILILQGFVLEQLPLPAPLNLPAGVLSPLLTWLWLVGVTNLFNFLDGIDGYAGWQATVGCAGVISLGLGPAMSAAAAAVGGAVAGFLCHNWHPARIFLGDVGSTALGFFLAASPLTAPLEWREEAVWAMGMLLWFFLSDGAYTLVKRLARGERIWTPHRSHLYQQLARQLGRHDAVVKRVGLAGGLLGAAAVRAFMLREPLWEWAVVVVAAASFAAYRHLVESGQHPAAAEGRRLG